MKFGRRLFRAVLWMFLYLTCLHVAQAQVTIQNPQHLEVPESRVQLLHQIIGRVVGSEFHLKPRELEGTLTLVVGESKGVVGKVLPGSSDALAVYLDRWDEAAFVVTDMQLMLHRVLSRGREKKMIRDILRRLNQTAPVSVGELQNRTRIAPNSPGAVGDCIAAITDPSRQGCTSAQFLVKRAGP